MSHPFGTHYLDEVRRKFRGYKRLAEGAIAQLKDEELFITLDPEANFVAVIMKHISDNMRSRFTDFLTTDGEKPDRQRDQEFEMNADATRAEVLRGWEEGWTSARVASAFIDRKSTRLNSSHVRISYAVFCLKKKTQSHTLG